MINKAYFIQGSERFEKGINTIIPILQLGEFEGQDFSFDLIGIGYD